MSKDKSFLGGMICEESLKRFKIFKKIELLFNRK